MRKLIVILFLFGICTSCKSQKTYNFINQNECQFYYDSTFKVDVYFRTSQPPSFDGGIEKCNSFIWNNVEVKNQDYIQGSFNINIVLNEKGKIIKAEISGKSTELTEQEKEFLRVISVMPPWIPAKCNEKNVYYKFTLPIRWKK